MKVEIYLAHAPGVLPPVRTSWVWIVTLYGRIDESVALLSKSLYEMLLAKRVLVSGGASKRLEALRRPLRSFYSLHRVTREKAGR